MSKSRGRGKTFNLSPFFRINMPKFSHTFIASKGTIALMTLPVTLPAVTLTHPIPPNSTQLSAFWYCIINQLFTVIYGMDASDSKSRAPCGHEGSGFAHSRIEDSAGLRRTSRPPPSAPGFAHSRIGDSAGLRLAQPEQALLFPTNDVTF